MSEVPTAEQRDRVALVTGAARGIGRAIVLHLARSGFDVAINDLVAGAPEDDTGAWGLKREIEKVGRRALVIEADVSVAEDRRRIVTRTVEQLGSIDLLVSNAGVAPKERLDILETTEESYDRVMGINLRGPFFLTQLVARQMITQRQAGRAGPMAIVFISSVSAYTSSPSRPEYCISKAGVSMLTALYADRLAEYDVRVYEIRPGIIETDMTKPVKAKYDKLIAEGLLPQKRWGRPDDVGRAVAAIAHGYLGYSTGQVLEVSGGFHLRRL